MAKGLPVVRALRRRFAPPVESVFSSVYRNREWHGEADFHSGAGSHDPSLTVPYVAAVRAFLESFPSPPQVVDLGCGDFAVGSQLTDLCSRYVACDVVTELVERNRREFVRPNLVFQRVDIIDDTLPEGDVACVRQVLQHLSNDQIRKISGKLVTFKYLVITEHIPIGPFVSNVDKLVGSGIRIESKSGVRLEDPPFDLRHVEKRVLCAPAYGDSLIETTLYRCF